MTAAHRPRARTSRGLVLLALAVLVGVGAWTRQAVARSDPGFDPVNPVGMLKSDPALLHYIAQRVVEAEGLWPADLRADPRVEHPRGADLLAEFTVGQELLVGWAYRILYGGGDGPPLHVFAQGVHSILAAAAVVGVFLLARAATGRARWGLFAALLAALLPANYRTIGFVWIREDLSLPLFALHGGLAAAAAVARGRRAAALALGSGLALALALATWHAMTFIVALEALACWLVALRGPNPLATRRGLLVLVPVVLAGALVPALSQAGFLLSAPMQVAAACLALAWVQRRGPLAPAPRLALGVAFLAASLALGGLAGRWAGAGGLDHVRAMILAKLVHLGQLPADPRSVPFDARLLWQGPFATLDLGWGAQLLFAGLLGGGLAVVVLLRRGALSPVARVLVVFIVLSLPAAWWVERTVVLPGLALPALTALGLAHLAPRVAGSLALAFLVVQGSLFGRFVAQHEIGWYRPPGLVPELRALVAALPDHVPPGEAVCADFVTSTAVLAHTGRPIVLQPKYETEASRRDAEAFLTTFFFGRPEELAELLRERFRCRYLLVDRLYLGIRSRWTAGLTVGSEPGPGSAAARLLSQDPATLEGVPEFELLYRSPATILQSNGEPYDLYRLYRLRD